jgi:hypothetical protein
MDEDQRKNLWVFLMMSMSNYESSCKETVFNEGPNGIASGLLQLHHESEDLYAKWDTDMNCDKGASMSARQSLKCGLTMLTRQVDQKKDFFSDQSHWQVLRYSKKPGTEAFQIRYAMSQIKECKADPVAMNLFGHWPIKERASTGVIVRKTPVLETPRVPASEIALLQPE